MVARCIGRVDKWRAKGVFEEVLISRHILCGLAHWQARAHNMRLHSPVYPLCCAAILRQIKPRAGLERGLRFDDVTFILDIKSL